VAAPLVLTAVALVAVLLPAARVSKLNAIEVLRVE
jgi:ABC-type lipoprotein release transport system permease subunit